MQKTLFDGISTNPHDSKEEKQRIRAKRWREKNLEREKEAISKSS